MRRTALLGLALLLPGCTGFGEFLRHVHTLPDANPNAPSADSLTLRRVLGAAPGADPLQVESGNVWPDQQQQRQQVPTLVDLQQNPAAPGSAPNRGEGASPPNSQPPGQPDGRPQRRRGSSTPPPSTPQAPAPLPRSGVQPPPPSVSTPPRDPTGSVVQTPSGPAIDSGGTGGYRQLLTPRGPGAIIVPNGNGTSTVINPDGSVQTIPTPPMTAPFTPPPMTPSASAPTTPLRVLYFAWLRERMGRAEEVLPVPDGVADVAGLVAWLAARDAAGATAFAQPELVRAAVNQDFATPQTPVHPGDEVALFPPVTGG